jgi:phage-related protein
VNENREHKPLFWVGSSQDDLRGFPEGVKRAVGFALRIAQRGGKHVDAKPLRGFAGAGVLEVVADDAGGTYRAVYTVRFAEAVYVLHTFQKKSTQGIKTAKHDIELIRDRLRRAEQHYLHWRSGKGAGSHE